MSRPGLLPIIVTLLSCYRYNVTHVTGGILGENIEFSSNLYKIKCKMVL